MATHPALSLHPHRHVVASQAAASDPAAITAGTDTRICFVGLGNLPVLAPEHDHHPIGGEQVQQTLLAKAFARRGYSISMVTADYGQADGAEWSGIRTYKAYAPQAGLPVVRFFHPRWSGLYSALRRANADVYYASCAGAMIGQVAIFCRRYGRKLIFRVASDADCVPELPLIKYWRDKKLFEYGLRHADAVLAQSEQQRELLWRHYRVESSLAGMLVELDQHIPLFEARDYSVLWVNNLRSLKRPDLFLEAARRLGTLDFHMAGGAAPGYQTFHDDFVAEARGQSNLRFHGQVPYHEVSHLYARARVFVNTSEIEGFPNSYLQAWSRGTPVVAFFDPDGVIAKEGLGIAVSTMEQLTNAVAALASDEREWRATSERCRRYMAQRYDEDAVLDAYRRTLSRLSRARAAE